MKVKIIGLVGSPRKNGNTYFLVNKCLEAAGELKDVETECIQLADYKYAGGCTACHQCIRRPGRLCQAYRNKQDEHNEVLRKVLTGDGFIFGTPVYIGGMTSQMKMFIDRLECVGRYRGVGLPLRNKPFGCVISGGARSGGQEATVFDLMRPFMFNDMIPLTPVLIFNPQGMNFFGVTGIHVRNLPPGTGPDIKLLDSKEGHKLDLAAQASAHNLGLRVAEMAKVIKAGFTLVNPENGETKWPAGALTDEFQQNDIEYRLSGEPSKEV